jgi:hypothetical protein
MKLKIGGQSATHAMRIKAAFVTILACQLLI